MAPNSPLTWHCYSPGQCMNYRTQGGTGTCLVLWLGSGPQYHLLHQRKSCQSWSPVASGLWSKTSRGASPPAW